MFPGNDRQDVEKGGKSKCCHRLDDVKTRENLNFFNFQMFSYNATVSIGSINAIEHRVSDAVQTNK